MIQTTDEQYHNHAREPKPQTHRKILPANFEPSQTEQPQISALFSALFRQTFQGIFFPQIEPLHRAKPSKENKDNRKRETKRHTTKLM